MMDYWNNLSQRERTLILIATGLLAVLALSFMVVKPVLSFHKTSVSDYEEAVDTYALVARAAQRPQAEAGIDMSALRAILTRTAGRNSIVIDRINIDGDAIDLIVSNAGAATLYNWLGILESDHDIVVLTAQIRPANSTPTVTARLKVARRG